VEGIQQRDGIAADRSFLLRSLCPKEERKRKPVGGWRVEKKRKGAQLIACAPERLHSCVYVLIEKEEEKKSVPFVKRKPRGYHFTYRVKRQSGGKKGKALARQGAGEGGGMGMRSLF